MVISPTTIEPTQLADWKISRNFVSRPTIVSNLQVFKTFQRNKSAGKHDAIKVWFEVQFVFLCNTDDFDLVNRIKVVVLDRKWDEHPAVSKLENKNNRILKW